MIINWCASVANKALDVTLDTLDTVGFPLSIKNTEVVTLT